jgi:nicotinamide-nucleotide amidase
MTTLIAKNLGIFLQQHQIKLVTAESCTGGGLAQAITAIPGSSGWFERGFVTYSNASKQELLGVKSSTLETYGAVSEQTAIEMAEGALRASHAQLSIAITGIAGPDGGSADKPVGTVWFAWSLNNVTQSELQLFSGDRLSIREQAVIFALEKLLLSMRFLIH